MNREGIAIVGAAGILPGAPDLDALWKLVVEGRSAARKLPPERWPDRESLLDEKGGPDRAFSDVAFPLDPGTLRLEDIDLDPRLVESLDLGHKAVLHAGAAAVRGLSLQRSRTGAIVAAILLPTEATSALSREILGAAVEEGVGGGERGPATDPLLRHGLPLAAELLAAGLGLDGGAMSLDAACASSLHALHLACEELRAGRVDAMLAGGACSAQAAYLQIGFTQLGALSRSGSCAPFDAAADGLLVGEGAVLFVLRRLSDAEREGQKILGVIRGVGISTDVGGSLLSPESEGQLRAMRAAWEAAGLSPHDADLIECHGTGTPRGDAVELASLTSLLEGAPYPPAIGSIKANVGHLLTGAGAAGLAKVLLALRERTLPPAPIRVPSPGACGAPVRLLATAQPWEPRAPDLPRRAAISAFGFGGTNAHLVVEEWLPAERPAPRPTPPALPSPVAIVGLAAHVGPLQDLKAFTRAALRGVPAFTDRPPDRWRHLESSRTLRERTDLRDLPGAWIAGLDIPVGRFRIPPREIPSILPQHLLALEVCSDAVADAGGLGGPSPHLRTGSVVALGLDLESTTFHLRWRMGARAAAHGAPDSWADAAREAIGPPLDAPRTLGALGGIVAARVARELSLGGPALTLTAGEAGGLRALELAAGALQRREVDAMVVAAVDLAGDVRQILADDALRPFSRTGAALPFDRRADGPLPGEGGVALVLKRLDDAVRDGDRVYAVVRGTGVASGPSAYGLALARAYENAGVAASSVSLVEGHGAADPATDRKELDALASFFGPGEEPRLALASMSAITGATGAASGLISVARAALSLFHETLPAHPGFRSLPPRLQAGPLHLPSSAQPWVRDRDAGPRRAGVSAIAATGTCAHAVLEGVDRPARAHARQRARPLGERPAALFLLRDGEAPDLARKAAGGATLEELAASWHRTRSPGLADRAVVASSREELLRALAAGTLGGSRRIDGELAFVFPGAGNLRAGSLSAFAEFPEILRSHDEESAHLALQLDPLRTAPLRTDWGEGSDADAARRLQSETARGIAAQAAISVALADVLTRLGVRPRAVIGYSLGESAALFFTRAWRDREGMLGKLLASPLFRTELAGPREAARRVLGSSDWQAAVVMAPVARVRQALAGSATLMVVNGPAECVIGGLAADLAATAERLSCPLVPIPGLATVHSSLVDGVADAYQALHELPVTVPAGIRFYAAASAEPYVPDTRSAARAITDSARSGFDFARVIERAWDDGVRVFVEPGPGASCTRMIGAILEGREHWAIALDGGNGFRSWLEALARLAEAGVPVDLDVLYGEDGGIEEARPPLPGPSVHVTLGGPPLTAPVPEPERPPAPVRQPARRRIASVPAPGLTLPLAAAEPATRTALAHQAFLQSSQRSFELQRQNLLHQQALLGQLLRSGARAVAPRIPAFSPPRSFEREACLEFARGSIAAVLGPAYAAADGFPTRVRLPDVPLLLVDRILSVEGTPGVLGPSRIVTEHQVREDAFYLDGGRAPTCVAIEAGQADLFLCSWLGIDLQTRGERRYRLLDATVRFHRDLPRPGETVRYDIRIDRFLRQGDTFLFFFGFEGTIAGEKLVTMRDGCAGFFSRAQLDGGAGIVGGPAVPPAPVLPGEPFEPMVAPTRMSLDGDALDALRAGHASVLGFQVSLPPALRLPGGSMHLVDRITELDTTGGRHGKGTALGELDVRPDAWYLTSHFCDDPVMPGTLMYECCAHTLRVLLLRMGVLCDEASAPADLHLSPLPGVEARLRCRGQVTPRSARVRFRVDVRAMGWDPDPWVIADASMFVDDLHAVEMEGLSLRIRGLDRRTAERHVAKVHGKEAILALASGSAEAALGMRFRPFDQGRFCARLPAPPFSLVDELVPLACEPLKLVEGARVSATCRIAPDAFHLERGAVRPGILLEVGLQPCGWLGAYGGVALRSETDRVFRVRSAEGRVLGAAGPGLLSTRGKVEALRSAGDAELMDVSFVTSQDGRPVHEGRATLGFFPRIGPVQLAGSPLPPAFPVLEDVRLELPRATARYRIDDRAFFFAAHFKDDPVMPASLQLDLARELALRMATAFRPGARFLATSHRLELQRAITPDSRELLLDAHLEASEGTLRVRTSLLLDGSRAGSIDGILEEA